MAPAGRKLQDPNAQPCTLTLQCCSILSMQRKVLKSLIVKACNKVLSMESVFQEFAGPNCTALHHDFAVLLIPHYSACCCRKLQDPTAPVSQLNSAACFSAWYLLARICRTPVHQSLNSTLLLLSQHNACCRNLQDFNAPVSYLNTAAPFSVWNLLAGPCRTQMHQIIDLTVLSTWNLLAGTCRTQMHRSLPKAPASSCCTA